MWLDLNGNSAEKDELTPFIAKLHARNVAKQLDVTKGLIYLPGQASEEYEDSDQPVFFRQKRYFYHLSGLDNPDCYVTYDIAKDELIAWIPSPNTGINVIFNGSNPSTDEISEKYQFDVVKTVKYLRYYIDDFDTSKGSKIYVLGGRPQAPFEAPVGVRQRPRTEALDRQSAMYWRGLNIDTVHLKPAMNACRVIKSPYEIKMIRKANEISAQAHINVLKNIKKISNESEIEAIFAGTCIAADAKSQAYGIIAGSGPNASTLHYVANNEPLKGRQVVCLDGGCEWRCYASDVTRTFPISGAFTPEAQDIYNLVASMQEECIAMIKPGVDFRSIAVGILPFPS
jgi:Xaa-Pro dipeptidase